MDSLSISWIQKYAFWLHTVAVKGGVWVATLKTQLNGNLCKSFWRSSLLYLMPFWRFFHSIALEVRKWLKGKETFFWMILFIMTYNVSLVSRYTQEKIAAFLFISTVLSCSLSVRAPDLWLKGCEFKSRWKRLENFLLQSQLCVLTLIRCPFYPRVTAVARKRPWSFCQKCRWQVTPKHAYTFDSTKWEWAEYAAAQA